MKKIVFLLCLCPHLLQAQVSKASWGRTRDGNAVEIYTLSSHNMKVRITTFGARVVGIETPDRTGHRAEVTLGYNNLKDYEADRATYFGATAGRFANRIAKGTFSLDGNTFHIPVNNGANALHGGTDGFDRKVWRAREIQHGIELSLVSPDGEMGFPGALTVHVRYTLEGTRLHIDYTATSTALTVVNLTNHTYFNLRGASLNEDPGTILDDVLQIEASQYLPIDATMIPTGVLAPVAGTPLDFRSAIRIGERIGRPFPQLEIAQGYDHNFVLDSAGAGQHTAAIVYEPLSGRTLTVTTTEPGLQFYSGNFLDGTLTGKFGRKYPLHAGLCLETQHFPDSPNRPDFPSTVFRPGEVFRSSTTYIFGVRP